MEQCHSQNLYLRAGYDCSLISNFFFEEQLSQFMAQKVMQFMTELFRSYNVKTHYEY